MAKIGDHEDVPEYLARHVHRMVQNLVRVDSMLDLYGFLNDLIQRHVNDGATLKPNAPDPSDTLRAVVVFLHASMEDTIRSIASVHLKRTDSALLQSLSLPNDKKDARLVKFGLADLVQFQGRTVDSLISEAFEQWLFRESFNNCDDIGRMLKRMGIDTGPYRQDFASVADMIARRHKIVHNADRRPDVLPTEFSNTTPISLEVVKDWRDGVERLLKRIIHDVQFLKSDVSVPPDESQGEGESK